MTVAGRLFDTSSALSAIERVYQAQRANRAAVASTTAAQRIAKIERLEAAIHARRDEIRAAMWADYKKPAGSRPFRDLSDRQRGAPCGAASAVVDEAKARLDPPYRGKWKEKLIDFTVKWL